MPELPEVAALVQFLGERAAGRTVTAADLAAIAALKTFDPSLAALVGRQVTGVARHGKWLDVDVDDLHLVFHLARGGWLRWSERAPTPGSPRVRGAKRADSWGEAALVRPRMTPGGGKGAALALRVRFDDGSGFDLTEAGTRKRLAVYVVRDPGEVPQIASLGPDPLEPGFTPVVLTSLMAARNQQIKGLLRDQGAIAGIGNAYSDEILHAARLSPLKLTRSFTTDETARLHAAIRDVLSEAVAAASGRPAAELKDAKRQGMRVHARTGERCPVCGDVVREISFADRSLQYCATCQTGGKILADRRMSRLLK